MTPLSYSRGKNMGKSERLNDMLIYLNDKRSFNLKDLMNKYSISKSTALRDIRSLEEIGMPVFTVSGRNGFYGILPNRLLSPIFFTVDEIYALYFSMQTLKAYQSTPFHMSIEKLKSKFEACISKEQIEMLRRMEQVFSLGSYHNKSECRYLSDILKAAIDESVCKIIYKKEGVEKTYYVQFFNISSAYGQWYATAYNFRTDKPQVFRCERIISIELFGEYNAKPLSQFLGAPKEIYKDKDGVDFEVHITSKGADIFYKEHYPSMELCTMNGEYSIKGFYNKNEERFIANYFLIYGEAIISIQPVSLKSLIIKRLNELADYFS